MKLQRIPTLLAALALAVPAISMADPSDHDRDHGHDRGHASAQHDRPDWDHPGYRHDDYRGAGPNHEWQRGGRLPNEYRGHQYVVDDWHGHHLSAPPRGYHWVQVNGGDYILAAVATGIILDTLLTQ
ncbi:MAG: RcnB family protein [Pseudomonadota bacterium]|nr:RcnB family protein [Pseudomonadota bacterium]